MSSDKHSGFELDDLIEAERQGVEPPATAAEQGWQALQSELSAAPVDPEVDLAPSELSFVVAAAASPVVPGLVLLALLVGLGGGAWLLTRTPTPSESSRPLPTSQRVEPKPGLNDEVELLGRAQAALEAEQGSEARRFLRSFRERHPQPILREELSALETRVACYSKEEGAGQGAKEFVRLHPRSPYADRVKADCGLKD